jgi:hypothetical protein
VKYEAIWNSTGGSFTVTEYADDAKPEDGEVILEDRHSDLSGAAEIIKENGFGFTDMWTRDRDGWDFKAPLRAMDRERPPE